MWSPDDKALILSIELLQPGLAKGLLVVLGIVVLFSFRFLW